MNHLGSLLLKEPLKYKDTERSVEMKHSNITIQKPGGGGESLLLLQNTHLVKGLVTGSAGLATGPRTFPGSLQCVGLCVSSRAEPGWQSRGHTP